MVMILNFKHKIIREKSSPVVFPDNKLQSLIDDLSSLIDGRGKIGLAANQIGVLKRVGVIKINKEILDSQKKTNIDEENKDIYLVLINPEIISLQDEYEVREGCLSYPGIYARIKRFKKCIIKNTKIDGTTETIEAEHLLSQAIQHEMEHFDGKTFVDNFSKLEKILNENKIKKIKINKRG